MGMAVMVAQTAKKGVQQTKASATTRVEILAVRSSSTLWWKKACSTWRDSRRAPCTVRDASVLKEVARQGVQILAIHQKYVLMYSSTVNFQYNIGTYEYMDGRLIY